MSKAIAVERQSTGSADADGHPSTPRSTNPKSPKNPTDVPRQSKLLPTRRPPLMIKPHGRLVSSRLTRQSHPDCRATGRLPPTPQADPHTIRHEDAINSCPVLARKRIAPQTNSKTISR